MKHSRWIIGAAAAATLLGVAGRLALPGWLTDRVNERMAHMGEYSGHVEHVHVHLWRGAYTLHEMLIEKTSGKVPVPLTHCPRVEVSVSWHELFHGALVARVEFDGLEANFVDGRGAGDSQTGRGVDWRAKLEEMAPMDLNEVRVRDGTVTFHNFISKPAVDLQATHVDATIHNLSNLGGAGVLRVATLDARADILGQAPLEAHAEFEPVGVRDFSFAVRVLKIDLTRLNTLAQAYGRLDFASGSGDFVMELDATDGKLKGYAKPLFRDVKIISWKQDVVEQHDNPVRIAWEWLADAATKLFKNQKTDVLATRVEIKGSLGDAQTSTWDALVAVLRNAFVQSYQSQYETLKK